MTSLEAVLAEEEVVVAWGWYLMIVADRPHPLPWVEGEVEHSRVLLDGAG